MPLDIAIEGVLFYKGQSVKKVDLAKLFSVDQASVDEALSKLSTRLESGATTLLVTDTHVQLVTDPSLDEVIESLRKDDLKRDIGKAGAETLAIILYREPISRAEIDRIRGVNSSYILRNLLIRGLVEKQVAGKGNAYTISPELLGHLGITNKQELPDYASVLDQLEVFEKTNIDEN